MVDDVRGGHAAGCRRSAWSGWTAGSSPARRIPNTWLSARAVSPVALSPRSHHFVAVFVAAHPASPAGRIIGLLWLALVRVVGRLKGGVAAVLASPASSLPSLYRRIVLV